jgi:hypothetical protein
MYMSHHVHMHVLDVYFVKYYIGNLGSADLGVVNQ